MSAPRITYTSTAADPEFRARFDRELASVRDRFGLALPCSIGGKPSASGRTRDVHSPIDTRSKAGSKSLSQNSDSHSLFPQQDDLTFLSLGHKALHTTS